MARFSTKTPSTKPQVLSHQGFIRDAEEELFLLAVSNMVGKDTFYESGKDRDSRMVNLVRSVAATNPEWIESFVPQLRDEMQMRSASIVVAAEYVHYALSQGRTGLRSTVNSALSRADEPAEFLGYWLATFGRKIPQPVKRGISDACARLYNEYSVQKYDSRNRGVSMADVLQLVHAKPKDSLQSTLYRYILTKRYKGNDVAIPLNLTMLTDSKRLQRTIESGESYVTPEMLKQAGWTWERLSTYGKVNWDSIIPTMGYMALLRNLRNFDNDGISAKSVDIVKRKLSDKEEVLNSRQFPLRFLSAYRNTTSTRWADTLEIALGHSVSNVPELQGNTLVLVDTSGSMFWSQNSSVTYYDIAATFAAAIALKNPQAKLVAYSNQSHEIKIGRGDAILRSLPKFKNWNGSGGGTDTWGTLARHWNSSYDRVIILTDEQDNGGNFYGGSPYNRSTRKTIANTLQQATQRGNVYNFNIAGYKHGQAPSTTANYYTFGGLTDTAFKAIGLLESQRDIPTADNVNMKTFKALS